MSILQTFIENLLRKGALLNGIVNTKVNQEAPVVYRLVEAGGNCKARQEKVKTLRVRHRFGAERRMICFGEIQNGAADAVHTFVNVHFCWGD